MAAPARAGNDRSVLVGNRAALTGGAVQACIRGGSAAYHNPAGLANVSTHGLDVTVSANGFRYLQVSGLLATPDGSSAQGSVLDWVLLPSASAYVRPLSEKVTVAFGVFVPEGSRYALRLSFASSTGARWFYTVQETLDEYQYTPAVAYQINPSLRIGLALAGIYRANYAALAVGVDAGSTGSAVYSEIISEGDYGLNASLGVQWDVSPKVHLGATIVSPALSAVTYYAATRIRNVAAPGAGADNFGSQGSEALVANWEVVDPAQLRAGIGLDFGRAHLAIDGDINTSLARDSLRLERQWLANVQVGGLYQLGPDTTLGAGFFTDFGAQALATRHYAGVALGIRMVRKYTLDDGRPLQFGSVFGLRYAYGWGSAQGARVQLLNNALEVTSIDSPFYAHELALNVGSELHF